MMYESYVIIEHEKERPPREYLSFAANERARAETNMQSLHKYFPDRRYTLEHRMTETIMVLGDRDIPEPEFPITARRLP